jgi:hypothetical protein
MDRHGGANHFVRPDRIVRTGVISPIVGYQPQRDVIAVTNEFASGPASGMQLAGYLGASSPGPVKRFMLRLQALIAQKKAERLMLTDAASGSIPGAPMAPRFVTSTHAGLAPQIGAMAEMARMLAYRNVPTAATIWPQRRWNSYFYSG